MNEIKYIDVVPAPTLAMLADKLNKVIKRINELQEIITQKEKRLKLTLLRF